MRGYYKMRRNFGAKPILYPQPVFIIATYGEGGVPNAMNAAWGGLSEETEIMICISAGHKTTKNILERGAFTVSMGTADTVVACDYVGVVSGNDVPDKFERAGFHAVPSELVDAPIIKELPMALECKLKSYDENTCRLIGEIVNVSCDEAYLDAEGRINTAKLRPITFDPSRNEYLVIGEKVGNAFRDGLALK